MFTPRRPTEARVIRYLLDQSQQPFSYRQVGATRTDCPAGFQADHYRVRLGAGAATFEAAKQAIDHWQMFPRKMCQLYWPDRATEVGVTVAVRFRAMLIWSLNPARIVYRVDQAGEVHRYGFAYGTLPDHVECGEERFLVQWDRRDDSVWYELYAISRPQHWLARLGYWYVRYQQRRFRILSGEAMQCAVQRLLGSQLVHESQPMSL